MIDLNVVTPCCAYCEGLIEVGEHMAQVDEQLSELTGMGMGQHICFWCYHGLMDDFDDLPHQTEMRQ